METVVSLTLKALMIFLCVYAVAGVLILVAGALIGAWIFFRGNMCQRGGGDGFFSTPKGEAFTIEGIDDVPNYPDGDGPSKEEQHLLKKAGDLFKSMGGPK